MVFPLTGYPGKTSVPSFSASDKGWLVAIAVLWDSHSALFTFKTWSRWDRFGFFLWDFVNDLEDIT